MKPRACSARVRQKGMNFYRERPCKLAGAVEVGGEWFCRRHVQVARAKAFDQNVNVNVQAIVRES